MINTEYMTLEIAIFYNRVSSDKEIHHITVCLEYNTFQKRVKKKFNPSTLKLVFYEQNINQNIHVKREYDSKERLENENDFKRQLKALPAKIGKVIHLLSIRYVLKIQQ